MDKDVRFMKNLEARLFRSEMTRDQCRDTGMAMVLIFLLLTLFFKDEIYIFCALCLHIVNMTVPLAYRPVAVIWLGATHQMGTAISWIILSIVFLVVVTPVGLLRRLMGTDSLRLKQFKAGQVSVMQERNHRFTAEDIQRPY
jgi:hypothetical protein